MPIAQLPDMYQDNLAWSCHGHGSLDSLRHPHVRELSQWTAEHAGLPLGPGELWPCGVCRDGPRCANKEVYRPRSHIGLSHAYKHLRIPWQVLLQPIEPVLGAWEEPPVGRVWVELQVPRLSSFLALFVPASWFHLLGLQQGKVLSIQTQWKTPRLVLGE